MIFFPFSSKEDGLLHRTSTRITENGEVEMELESYSPEEGVNWGYLESVPRPVGKVMASYWDFIPAQMPGGLFCFVLFLFFFVFFFCFLFLVFVFSFCQFISPSIFSFSFSFSFSFPHRPH